VKLLAEELAKPTPSARPRRRHQLVDVSLVVRDSVTSPTRTETKRRA